MVKYFQSIEHNHDHSIKTRSIENSNKSARRCEYACSFENISLVATINWHRYSYVYKYFLLTIIDDDTTSPSPSLRRLSLSKQLAIIKFPRKRGSFPTVEVNRMKRLRLRATMAGAGPKIAHEPLPSWNSRRLSKEDALPRTWGIATEWKRASSCWEAGRQRRDGGGKWRGSNGTKWEG